MLFRDVKGTGLARMAHQQIALCIGRKRRTVVRAIKELEKAGLITVVERGGLNRGPSTYRLHGSPQRVPPVTQVRVTKRG